MGFEVYKGESIYDSTKAKNVKIKFAHAALFNKNDKF